MKLHRIFLPFALLLALALLVVGCGGGDDDVPSDAIAVVGDEEIPKRDYDALVDQAKRSYKTSKKPFPKAGTPEYESVKNQAVLYLVQREQFEQKAEELDVEVGDEEVDARLKQIIQQYFGGNEQRYRQQLKQTGLTEERVRDDVRAQLIQEKLFEKVTEDVEVTDEDIEEYYEKNKTQYGQPASRDVRHILVPTKRQADRIYARLQTGADFAALAKKFSKDPGSKDQGGKLTIARGQTVPAFDRTAFRLKKGQVSRPVKTQYGFHIIEPLSAVKPAKTTPLKDVKAQIKQQLLQTKKNEAMTEWVEDTKKDFEGDTTYQVGFKPPATKSTTGTTSDR